ncbi:MAG TPA: ATP-binding protein [Capsulimonadaceae bacterium]|jgi:two-component system sensor histidine kinase CpxA
MNRLVVKVFLWFWLTAIVCIVLSAAIFFRSRSEGYLGRLTTIDPASFRVMAQTVADMADSGDTAHVALMLRRISKESHLETVLLSDGGSVLAIGGPVQGLPLKAASLMTGSDEKLDRYPGALWRLKRVVASSGRAYIFACGIHGNARLLVTPVLRIGLLLVATTIACALLARFISRPIAELSRASRALADGNLDTRVHPSSANSDETRRLFADFNAMAERLGGSVDAQKRLLADISHELRSPLARVNLALGLARRVQSDELRPYLDRIEASSERIDELVGHLVTLSVLDSASPLVRGRIDFAELVTAIVDDANFEARARDGKVTLVGATEPVWMEGDRNLLRSAIENVVRNAVRHEPDGGEVLVDLAVTDAITVTVRDHGPGVPDAELAAILQPFYRVEAARDRKSGGVGLGLAISHRALVAHGGAIALANATDGGLQVTMMLPRQ